MAQAKNEAFAPESIRLAAAARALAHPGRLRLLEVIASRNACVCGDLVDLMPLAQSTVSQHLRELKEAGLIRGLIAGPRTCYCLDHENIESVRRDFARLFAELGQGAPGKGDDHVL